MYNLKFCGSDYAAVGNKPFDWSIAALQNYYSFSLSAFYGFFFQTLL